MVQPMKNRIVMDCKHGKRAKPPGFRTEFDHFHWFELRRLSRHDVTIHSYACFEQLMQKNYMLAVECVFYPAEFMLRSSIDYKGIYRSKYYHPLRLKQVALYENMRGLEFLLSSLRKFVADRQRVSDRPTSEHFFCDAVQMTSKEKDRPFK